jgi:hypothetical protein
LRSKRKGDSGGYHAWNKTLALPHYSLEMARRAPSPRTMLEVVVMLRMLAVCLMRKKRKKKKFR